MNRSQRRVAALAAMGVFGIASLGVRADDAPTPAAYKGLPYSGKPVELPGTVEAEAYDISPDAANDVSFHYDGRIGKNAIRTSPDAIGLAKNGNGHVSIKGEAQSPDGAYIGWTQTGQWLKYSVRVKDAGIYVVGGHFAAAGKDALLSFTFAPTAANAPATMTGPLAIPTTDGFQPGVEVYHVWETLDNLAEVNLPKGDYVMTVKIERNAGLNLDSFTIAKKP